jgi:hypothetical protein
MNLTRIKNIGIAIAAAVAVGANATECELVAPGQVCSAYLVALQNEDIEQFVGLVHSSEYAEWVEDAYAILGSASEELRPGLVVCVRDIQPRP